MSQQRTDPDTNSDGSFNILSCAFGPGLTLDSMILEANYTPTTRLQNVPGSTND